MPELTVPFRTEEQYASLMWEKWCMVSCASGSKELELGPEERGLDVVGADPLSSTPSRLAIVRREGGTRPSITS